MSVRNYHYLLGNYPEQHSSQLLHSRKPEINLHLGYTEPVWNAVYDKSCRLFWDPYTIHNWMWSPCSVFDF